MCGVNTRRQSEQKTDIYLGCSLLPYIQAVIGADTFRSNILRRPSSDEGGSRAKESDEHHMEPWV
jgi:hypothetical protein